MTKLAVTSCLLLGAAACLELPPDEVGTEAAADIGVCGANMDPLSGVECRYGAATPIPGTTERQATVETGPDGLDYVVCRITVSCSQTGEAQNGGHTCVSVIGTGCPDRVTRSTRVSSYPLPPGSPPLTEEDLASYCRFDTIPRIHCDAVPPATEEHGEDLCCILREPSGPPPPVVFEVH